MAFYTLGCKMNFHETAYLEEQFKGAGYRVVPFEEEADVYVINTCTVTHTADAKSRKAIRRAKQRNPKALVVVTGCYSEVYPEDVEKVKEADLITGNVEKQNLVELVEARLRGELPRTVVKGVWRDGTFQRLTIEGFEGRTRAFVKVQQGCQLFCTYCIIPKARGPMVSLPPQETLSQIKRLVEAGYKEIVLTGTHLGAYGREFEGWSLARLVEEAVKIPGLYRLRLSSVEPVEFTPHLIEVITGSEKVAPHYHVPLQSGSKSVLERMGRRYTPSDYERVIEELVKRRPECCVGTDVMVGFPGESEEEFNETLEFIKSLPLGYLHVFPYSRRRGTVAARLRDSVTPQEKRRRGELLREVGTEKSVEFRKRFLGKELEGLVIKQSPYGSVALTGNYIQTILNGEVPTGSTVKFTLTKVGRKREENYGKVSDRALLRNAGS
ncbi:tRNA (N(6)-L-threonylcarbamoyladenosine(37)-C(2))-methylthiotransferase MtaB [Thermovibrio ammonificans]